MKKASQNQHIVLTDFEMLLLIVTYTTDFTRKIRAHAPSYFSWYPYKLYNGARWVL